jgi:NAD+ synthase
MFYNKRGRKRAVVCGLIEMMRSKNKKAVLRRRNLQYEGEAMDINPAEITAKIEAFIRGKLEAFQREGAVLGMSGGLDSAVVCALLSRALGPEKVLALILPERDSSAQSKADALLEIKRLGVAYREINLTPILEAIGIYKLVPLHFLGIRQIKESVVQQQHRKLAEELGELPLRAGLLGTRDLGRQGHVLNSGLAYAHSKHRLRMVLLYYIAEQENRLVVGTTNKSEVMVGSLVKWGDNVADIELITPLYKTQVRQLAAYLGVTQKIIDKAPTADLMPGIVDEEALGVDYATLDTILWRLEQGWEPARIAAGYPISAQTIQHVQEMMRRSGHMREMPPHAELDMQD